MNSNKDEFDLLYPRQWCSYMENMLPELDLDLTLEQKFQMQLIEKELAAMSQEKMKDLLLKTSHLLMVKENVIRTLTKRVSQL
jgi:hypothetical protein